MTTVTRNTITCAPAQVATAPATVPGAIIGERMEAHQSFPATFADYLTGMRLYTAMQSVEACQTDAQRRGWWDGLNAEAGADPWTEDADTWQGVSYPCNAERFA